MADIPFQQITVAKGQDFTRYIRIFDGVRVQLAANAAASATSLTLQPDHPAIASGDKLLFGNNVIVTTDGASAAGATTVSVVAIPGPLNLGDYGQRIVKDLSGYTFAMEVLTNREDGTAIIALTPTSADDPADPAGSGKADIVTITGAAADTASDAVGTYYFSVWRSNSGSTRPLVEGEFIITPRGFLT